MRYKCSICGKKFESWPEGSATLAGHYDQVFIRRRDPATQTIGSISYTCCPRCADRVWTFVARLAETSQTLSVVENELSVVRDGLDDLVQTLGAMYG